MIEHENYRACCFIMIICGICTLFLLLQNSICCVCRSCADLFFCNW